MATVPNASRYAIPAVSPEKERLAQQYAMKKSTYGWTSPVPDTINLSIIHTVLDIAAGTCVWSLDLATSPQIRDRNDVQIYACDIDTKFFPPTVVTDEHGIKTFEQDVTKPFPAEYHGSFDLVHISFLVLCLTEEGWNIALANVHRLLKPGGLVMIDELDPVMFKDEYHSRPAYTGEQGYDLRECMMGTTWLHKLNCLYTSFSLQNSFIVGLSFRLGDMLQQAGFTIEKRLVGTGAVGKMCRVLKGADGGSLAEYEETSVDGTMFLLTKLGAIMRQKGTAEVPLGNRITTEEEIASVLREIQQGLQSEGAIIPGACFVALKV
ncbi:hypothetical protein B0H11DRAFT_2037390 [Mycena galericulata]|nr:hypothetical protein B0H11DRAFT_2037390 [Mycena galericulata]